MFYDREQVAGKLRRWEKYLSAFTLPSWEELPELDLYMDQVVALMGKYLTFLPMDEYGQSAVTASAINNYVRLKIMPPPYKKRYSRIHIAYLIMICTLKQSVNIAYIQRIIPVGLSEDEVRAIYEDYVSRHEEACAYFIDQVRDGAQSILHPDGEGQKSVSNFVYSTAILAGLSKLLTEKIVRLQANDRQETDAISTKE